MAGIDILFLSKDDIDALDLGLAEVMDAIERGLRAHGEKRVIMPSKALRAAEWPASRSSATSRRTTSTVCRPSWPC
jgi:hypothetical protein